MGNLSNGIFTVGSEFFGKIHWEYEYKHIMQFCHFLTIQVLKQGVNFSLNTFTYMISNIKETQ